MKLIKLALIATLSFSVANAENVMQKSMSMMDEGMTLIQKGFINSNIALIKDGAKLVDEGNALFSDEKIIKEFLPKDKKHMINVAENASKRISLDLNVLELNVDEKAYVNAANAYSDMLNACSRCHSIVREW
ncbi:MAG: hypothetical protein C0626_11365 [Arcobacter sp.]|uniref:hypothetical protein n=1 Tax=uncultured Arcobacter sp. TaxID=165434 RepID=UPI000CBD5676|nr:hypothetical protein [uncultured Arcobacter sp.]PLY09558.1 MAG: hypothetical protein C0626_11365 [Arcobacter sp.]